MKYSALAFVGLIVFVGLAGLASTKPLVHKDFFWYQTEDGSFVPAFLKEIEGPPNAVQGIEDNVIFWHYLPCQQEGLQITPHCTDNCLSGFAQGAPLVLAAHGFSSSHTGGFGNRSEPINMVFINWSKLASLPDYAGAVKNVGPVGEYVATLVNYLVEEGVASLDQTYFIGHSLGAHVANHVGANLNGGMMRTIFALDPASPLFEGKGDDERIDPSDAHFVNVIHTSKDFLGMEEPQGHVDFYPNSGEDQPGCWLDPVDKCSHSRAYHFLGESIMRPQAFQACKCDSWDEFDEGRCACNDSTVMGWETPSTARGVYYLKTNANSPYGQS